MAQFNILINHKAARHAIGARASIDDVTTAMAVAIPGFKSVRHDDQSRFALYQVRTEVATRFDCASRHAPGSAATRPGAAGEHFASVFRIVGSRKDASVALLWAKEKGYWKIVSWQAEPQIDPAPIPETPPLPPPIRVTADATLVEAARNFLDTWMVRKDYDAAFRYLSKRSYACYDLMRGPEAPPSTSPDDGGRRIRAGLERVGTWVGASTRLDAIIEPAEPVTSSSRVVDQPYSRIFTLTSLPAAIADAVECDVRARGDALPDPGPLQFGETFGLTFRLRTEAGETPVLRLLWRKEANTWRITAYDVEVP
jgi:hypothetical protein